MFNIFKKREVITTLYAPVKGCMVPLTEVNDTVFSSGMMGQGVAFRYDDNTICAPIDGTITLVANTKHAFGMMSAIGVEVLVHIGVDTVNLQGEGFDILQQVNSKVKAGTPVVHLDIDFMLEKEMDLTTPIIITNSQEYICDFTDAKTNVIMKQKIGTVKKK